MSELWAKKLFGEYEINLDDKGRFTVPPEFREGLGDSFVLTRGPDQVALMIPMAVWAPIEQDLYGPTVKISSRLLQRLFAFRQEVHPDTRSRLMLPKTLQDWMRVEGDQQAVLLGMGSIVEIWTRSNWIEYQRNFSYENVIEAAESLGITQAFRL